MISFGKAAPPAASLALIAAATSMAGCAIRSNPATHASSDTVKICYRSATNTECYRESNATLEGEMEAYHEVVEMTERERFEE